MNFKHSGDGRAWCHDGIEVKDLTLQHAQRTGCDAWGRQKEQPLLLSVKIALNKSFASAAAKDALDGSTMHYGLLSKRVRSLKPSSEWESLEDFASRVHDNVAAEDVSKKLFDYCQVGIKLPKASLLGNSVLVLHTRSYTGGHPEPHLDWVLGLIAVTIPVLVGVNANERARKQPLLFDLWIRDLPGHGLEAYAMIEALLVKTVEHTQFETLESLIIYTVQRLYDSFFRDSMSQVSIRMRIEKPMAVPYAEAPIVEISRTAEDLNETPGQNTVAEKRPGLRIVRPYHA